MTRFYCPECLRENPPVHCHPAQPTTLAGLAVRFKVPVHTLRKRLYEKWSLAEALNIVARPHPAALLYCPQCFALCTGSTCAACAVPPVTMKALCMAYATTVERVKGRLNKRFTLKEALTLPLKRQRRSRPVPLPVVREVKELKRGAQHHGREPLAARDRTVHHPYSVPSETLALYLLEEGLT